jgi:hypothetical protein
MKRLALALPLLIALLAAACGGSSTATPTPTVTGGKTTSSTASLIAAAGEKTRAAGSARFSVEMSMNSAQGTGTISGEGVTGRNRAHMTMNLGGLAGSTLGHGEAEIIFENLVYYLRLPASSASQLPSGKTWLKVDLGKLSKQGGFDFSDLMQLNQTDPSQTLEFLRGAGEFKEVGKDQVRGEEATKYHGTVDVNKAVENAPAEARDQARKIFEQAGVTTIPMDIWVDGEGLVRQLEFKEDVQGMSLSVHEELYDFGAEVDTTPPPADHVLDITDLLANS